MTIQKRFDAGMLDPTFGDEGMVIIEGIDPQYRRRYVRSVTSVGTGPDSKIYFAGFAGNGFGDKERYFVGRLNSDGTPDTKFGGKGIVQDVFPRKPQAMVTSFAVQPDEKIVIQGYEEGSSVFARFNANGTLDMEFGENGYSIIDFDNASSGPPLAHDRERITGSSNGGLLGVEILPDGKIVACTYAGYIVRLTQNGALDKDFNRTGYLKVDHPDYPLNSLQLYDILVQSDGKYVACGTAFPLNADFQATFVRCDSAGSIDRTFGTRGDGFVVINGPAGVGIERMTRQPNQRILGVGSSYEIFESGVLHSLEPDGKPNIQFNRGEPLYTSLESNKRILWMGAAIQKDGKIVTAATLGDDSTREYEVVVARFINEKIDTSFGNGQGWVRTRLPDEGGGYPSSIALQDDGKILVSTVGRAEIPRILRYLP